MSLTEIYDGRREEFRKRLDELEGMIDPDLMELVKYKILRIDYDAVGFQILRLLRGKSD